MDANAQHELYLIKNELQGIIDELYSIAGGVSRDFEGIGNSQCANSILKAAAQYETVKQKLNTMNLSVVTEEFAAKQRAKAEAKARAAQAKAQAEAKAKAEAAAKAKAEAEAKAKAEAEAKAKAEAEAKAKAQSSKTSSSNSNNKKSNNVLEDLFGWLFK